MTSEATLRRFEPERRDRNIDAALRVIARAGVGATTHRSVAKETGVPVGWTTYHFASLDELLTEAFIRHVDRLSHRFEARMALATTRTEVIDAVVATIEGDLTERAEDLAVKFELYGAASRRADLKVVTQAWKSVRPRRWSAM